MSVAILDLLRSTQAKPTTAGAAFTRFLEAQGSPVVDGDTATFLFDDATAEAVFLVHWAFGLETRQPFRRIPHTGGWFLSIELPRGSRVEYKFEVHRDGGRTWVKDPHNRYLAFDPFGSNSVCRMTGYADPSWVFPDPDNRPGTLESFELTSPHYGQAREIGVYLPYEYKPHKHYPLLVCHDGDDYRRFAGIRTVLDNLIARHEVRPLVVAFTTGGKRNEEYAANPVQADYVVQALLPALQARYGLSDDPRERGLLGASFGAVTSLYTAWRHPGVFGQLLLQSGSFVFTDVGKHERGPLWDPVVDFVNTLREDPARIDARIYMSCGIFESLIYYNRSLAPRLRKAGLDVRFEECRDGHNWIGWRDSLRDGLTYLFPGQLRMTYD